jgi:hypothetical protein
MVYSWSRRAVFYLFLVLFFSHPQASWAWGAGAHRIIALVADRLLEAQSSATQKKIAGILATDQSNTWTKTDIASEATWADALLDKSIEGRYASMKWHYVKLDPNTPDLNKACFGRPTLLAPRPASRGPQDNCIVDKIEQFAKELRDPGTLASERLAALQFLLNLVGDIHDPLYAIERNDQNGRCVAVLPAGAKSAMRLDAYWDDALVAEAMGKDAGKAAGQIAATLAPAEVQKWSSGSPEQWARESYDLAKTVVYDFPTQPESRKLALPVSKGEKDACGPVPVYRLDAAYHQRAIGAIKTQLAKAGVRLAFLLRENLH